MTWSGDQGGTSSARGARTRRTILAAAAELIGEQGWEGVSTRDIARRAGVTQGVVTYHWRSKDDLLRDAALAATEELIEPFAAAVETAPVGEVLLETVRALGGLRDDPGKTLLLMETMLRPARDEVMRTALGTMLADYRRLLAAAIEREQVGGRVRGDLDAAAVATALAAALDGLILHALVDEDLDLEAAVRALLAGIAPR